jgi:predicted amidohydrolase YtcJ
MDELKMTADRPTSASCANEEAERLSSVTPGKLADLVAYPIDPLTADLDDLAQPTPAFTTVGGKAVYDPDKRLRR